MTMQPIGEIWENGRYVCGAMYDPDRIAPMQPYRAPRTQHRAIAPAPPVREYARDSCTPSRYNAMTRNRYAVDDRNSQEIWAGWDGELPDEEPLPEPVQRVVYPQLKPVAPPPPPIAVPNWPVRPVVVEADPVPIVVNHTAARFGSLEIRR
jgi:hypothetical protein